MANVESKKIVRSAEAIARSKALATIEKKLAKAAKQSVTQYRAFLLLSAEARSIKAPIAEHVAAFDALHPVAVKGEWEKKLAELDAVVTEARKLNNATMIAFAMSTREKEIKRHEAQIKNVDTAKKNKLARKASAVTSTSFDEFGMPIVAAA